MFFISSNLVFQNSKAGVLSEISNECTVQALFWTMDFHTKSISKAAMKTRFNAKELQIKE